MTFWRLIEGDCIEQMRGLDAASIDCVVTDPPYGIGFMGHEWDQPGIQGRRNDLSVTANRSFQAWCEAWAAECLRLLKPGGHLLAFGGCRTFHRLAAGIEDAGFEIRDQIDWLFGSGFPKSRRLADGVGTALKPGHEPICLARAPLVGTTQATFDAHGTGGLNIDAARIDVHPDDPVHDAVWTARPSAIRPGTCGFVTSQQQDGARHSAAPHDAGRWPANVVLDEDTAAELDEQTGALRSGANPTRRCSDKFRQVYGDFAGQAECDPARGADAGGASRFYYCAKTSTAERNTGLDGFPAEPLNWSSGEQSPGTFQSAGPAIHRNGHPTVKPVDLMRWLIRLAAPPGGIVLDPFTGSGSTGIAALREARSFVGIEREPEYVALARARIIGDAPLLNTHAEVAA